MGINPKAFNSIRSISKRFEKEQKQRDYDKKLIESGYFKTETAKNDFLKSREKLYNSYDLETEKITRKAITDFGKLLLHHKK